VLEALTDQTRRDAFLAEYDARLRAAYPRTPIGVIFPFRRIFLVAHRPGGEAA
jgi:trans-aconitate 2-methyltransferase